MSLSEVTKKILSVYNKKYDVEEKLLEKEMNTQIEVSYTNLLLCCDTQFKKERFLTSHEDIDPVNLYKENPRFVLDKEDQCSLICALQHIVEDKTFVKKMMQYRIAEIQKKLLYIKYMIEVYKFVITCKLNLTYKRESGMKIILEKDITSLQDIQARTEQSIYRYILDSEDYIVNTSLCNYLLLMNRFKTLVQN